MTLHKRPISQILPTSQLYRNDSMFYSYPYGESNASILDMKQLKMLRIYEDLCTVTTNQKLRDFFWFNRLHVYHLFNKEQIQEGVWSNDGIHAIISSNMSILVGNCDVSIRISYDHTQCDIRKNDDASDITISDIVNGVIPSLKLIMHLCGIDSTEEKESFQKMNNNDNTTDDDDILEDAVGERIGRGKRRSYRDIGTILKPYLENVNSLKILSEPNYRIWNALHDLNRQSTVQVSGAKVSFDRGAEVRQIKITTDEWILYLPAIDSGRYKPYNAFSMLDVNNENDLKAVAQAVDALYKLTTV